MKTRSGLARRMLIDLLAGLSAAALVAALGWLGAGSAWAIPALCVLLIAAGAGGYREPSARRVWIHPLVIMSPALVAATCAALTCRGFECGGVAGLVAGAVLFTLVLVGLSYAAFYARRRAAAD